MAEEFYSAELHALEEVFNQLETFAQKIGNLLNNLENYFVRFDKTLNEISKKKYFQNIKQSIEDINQVAHNLDSFASKLENTFQKINIGFDKKLSLDKITAFYREVNKLSESFRNIDLGNFNNKFNQYQQALSKVIDTHKQVSQSILGLKSSFSEDISFKYPLALKKFPFYSYAQNLFEIFRQLKIQFQEFQNIPQLTYASKAIVPKINPFISFVKEIYDIFRNLKLTDIVSPQQPPIPALPYKYRLSKPLAVIYPESVPPPPPPPHQPQTPEKTIEEIYYELLTKKQGLGLPYFQSFILDLNIINKRWTQLLKGIGNLFNKQTFASFIPNLQDLLTQLKLNNAPKELVKQFEQLIESISLVSKGKPLITSRFANIQDLQTHFNNITNRLSQFSNLFTYNWPIIDRDLGSIAQELQKHTFRKNIGDIIKQLEDELKLVKMRHQKPLIEYYTDLITNLKRIKVEPTRFLGIEAIRTSFQNIMSEFVKYQSAFAEVTTKTTIGGSRGNLGNPIWNFITAHSRTARGLTADWEKLRSDFQRLDILLAKEELPKVIEKMRIELKKQMEAVAKEGKTELVEGYQTIIRDLETVAKGGRIVSGFELIGREISKTFQNMFALMGQQLLFGFSFALVYLPVQRFIMQGIEQVSNLHRTLEETFKNILVLPNIGDAIKKYVTKELVPSISQINQYIMTLTGIYRSPEVAQRLVRTALEISKVQPIQFEQAMRLFTAFAVYPSTQYALGANIPLKTINEFGKQIEIPFSRMLAEVAQYLAMLAPPPQGGIHGAIIALTNMFTGEYRSLQRRFNVRLETLAQYANTSLETFKEATPVDQIRLLHIALSRMLGSRVLRLRGADLMIQINNIIDNLKQMTMRTFIEIPMKIHFNENEIKRIASLWGKSTDEMRKDIDMVRTNIIGNLAGIIMDFNQLLSKAFERSDFGMRIGIIVRRFVEDIEKQVVLPKIDEVGFEERLQRLVTIWDNTMRKLERLFKPYLKPMEEAVIEFAQNTSTRITELISRGMLESIRKSLATLAELPLNIMVHGGVGREMFSYAGWVKALSPFITAMLAKNVGFFGQKAGTGAALTAFLTSSVAGSIHPILSLLPLFSFFSETNEINNLLQGLQYSKFKTGASAGQFIEMWSAAPRLEIFKNLSWQSQVAIGIGFKTIIDTMFMKLNNILKSQVVSFIQRFFDAVINSVMGYSVLEHIVSRTALAGTLVGKIIPWGIVAYSGFELVKSIFNYYRSVIEQIREFNNQLRNWLEVSRINVVDAMRTTITQYTGGMKDNHTYKKIFSDYIGAVFDCGVNFMRQLYEIFFSEKTMKFPETWTYEASRLGDFTGTYYQFNPLKEFIRQSKLTLKDVEKYFRRWTKTLLIGNFEGYQKLLVEFFRKGGFKPIERIENVTVAYRRIIREFPQLRYETLVNRSEIKNMKNVAQHFVEARIRYLQELITRPLSEFLGKEEIIPELQIDYQQFFTNPFKTAKEALSNWLQKIHNIITKITNIFGSLPQFYQGMETWYLSGGIIPVNDIELYRKYFVKSKNPFIQYQLKIGDLYEKQAKIFELMAMGFLKENRPIEFMQYGLQAAFAYKAAGYSKQAWNIAELVQNKASEMAEKMLGEGFKSPTDFFREKLTQVVAKISDNLETLTKNLLKEVTNKISVINLKTEGVNINGQITVYITNTGEIKSGGKPLEVYNLS